MKVDTLRKRVEQSVLQSETVARNRLGITNVSNSISPDKREYSQIFLISRWLSWMHRPTGDQEVAGSTPAEVGNILSWRLIMKYFLRSFSPFR